MELSYYDDELAGDMSAVMIVLHSFIAYLKDLLKLTLIWQYNFLSTGLETVLETNASKRTIEGNAER